jgi:PAS domain S-box-containing protein
MTEIEKQLIIENNELRIRLAENKMLIHVLQKDGSDKKIAAGRDFDSNTVLTRIDDPYLIIIEEMDKCACILSKDNKIKNCNKSFIEIFSTSEEQIIGSDFQMLITRNDKSILELLQLARSNETSGKVITFVKHPDNVKYYFLLVISISFDSSDELFIIFTDITEIKKQRLATETLLNNTRLAALNIMEDEIAAKNELEKTNQKLLEEIKERKKSEHELQQSKQNLLQAQKIAHIGNWSYDLKIEQITLSEEIFRIFEFDQKQLTLNIEDLKKLAYHSDWEAVKESIETPKELGVKTEFELQIHRSSGEYRTVFVICTPQLNVAGKAIKLIGTIQDITERKKTEETLIKVNRLYTVIRLINQMIIHNQRRETIFTEACNIVIEHGKFRMAWIGLLDETNESIIPVTWAGAELGYFKKSKKLKINNTLEENGPTAIAIQKKKFFYCNDIANDPAMKEWSNEALKRDYHASISFPISVFNKTIGAFTIYVSEPNFFNQTEIDLLLQVTSDISFALEVTETEKKRLDAEKAIKKMNAELEQRVMFRTQQLENINKELESFTYSVSHDLRSPLRNISEWSKVLIDECKVNLGKEGLKYMDRVLAETLRMNNLIDDLMKLSKVNLTKRERDTVDLTHIAKKIAQQLQDKPINHKLEFIIEPGLVAIGDPRMLDIALTNLLENSYKFTGKQAYARIEFGMSFIKGIATFWVRDNGVGFNMENSKNLFGVFQRMHNQNEFPGTGIGLATVQRIIHRHDGRIWAESKINEGTTFYFTIPDNNL